MSLNNLSKKSIGKLPLHIGDGNYSGKYPKATDFIETGIPFISASDFSEGRIKSDNFRFISEQQHETLLKGQTKFGDVLVVTRGNGVGNVAWVDEEFNNCNLNAQLALLRSDEKEIHNKFLYYLLSSPKYKEILISYSSGSAQPQLPIRALKLIELSFPEYDKQKSIAKILSDLDDKIHLNNQINQTLESIAQAIFKSWFIDFDPVRAKIAAKQEGKDSDLAAMCAISGKNETELEQMAKEDFAELQATAALFPDELVESELGEVPKGWGLQSLYDTAEFVNGAAFKAKDFSSNTKGLPIIKIAELKQGLSAQTKYTNSSFDKKYKVSSGDIFYSWSGSPETSLDVFKWFGGDGWLNQHIFKINTKSKGQTYFVYYLLKYLKPTLIRLATNKQTTGLGHITVADMKALKVIKPEGNLFLNYARIIAPLYEKESLLKQESIDLGLLRDNLLPKLLSGEIDISVMNREQI